MFGFFDFIIFKAVCKDRLAIKDRLKYFIKMILIFNSVFPISILSGQYLPVSEPSYFLVTVTFIAGLSVYTINVLLSLITYK